MAITPPKAPTAPTPPTSPNADNAVPSSEIQQSGPTVPAGELHTPAENFGIHIRIGGSEAVQPEFTEDGKNTTDTANSTSSPQAQASSQPAKKQAQGTENANDKGKPQQIDGQQVMQYLADDGGKDEDKNTEGSLKVAPQDDSVLSGFTDGHITYWPFLFVFIVAFISFFLMMIIKRKENTPVVNSGAKDSPKTTDTQEPKSPKENKPRFEVRI